MKKPLFYALLFMTPSLCLLTAFLIVHTLKPRSAAKPNLVLILVDDMGYADLGANGCTDIPTPHMDRIAHGGVRFTDAYANGSYCAPTRAALMSGCYQHRFGNDDLPRVSGPLFRGLRTLPERLREHGYHTAMIGKWHLGEGKGHTPLDRGFDEFYGFYGGGHYYFPNLRGKNTYSAPLYRDRTVVEEARYLTYAFGVEASAFLERQRNSRQPFFLYLAFNAVHTPLQAPPDLLRKFEHIQDKQRRFYAAMTSALDTMIGLVLDKLEDTGQRENTFVVFHNDNGGPTTRNAVNGSRNTPLRGSKCETFEGGVRVATFMQWPGKIEAGSTYTRPVMTFDITATLLAAAGADTLRLDGVNLLPHILGQTEGAPHKTLFWRNGATGNNNCAMRQGPWKYVRSTEDGMWPDPGQRPASNMLFNLKQDIAEQRDLSRVHPEKLESMINMYQHWSDEMDACSRRHRHPESE